MSKFISIIALCLLFIGGVSADTYVNGYYKKNGTYVQPHYRSSPDSSYNNNWSVKPNTNPYTGKRGTRNPKPSDNYGYGNSNNYNKGTGLQYPNGLGR